MLHGGRFKSSRDLLRHDLCEPNSNEMNHMRSIKEMLSIPTGSSRPCGDKTINRNVATSGHSSFSDSQIFFGSQFWPENSQGMSQDMSLSSRTSQQSSQEGSDPKFSSTYHTKPFLFGEFKDKSKAFGILDTFEEERKRAKEKTEGNILAKACQETLNNIQQLVACTERNTAVCQTVLQKCENFASLQNNLSGLQSGISQQFETLLSKVNSQKEIMCEVEQRVQKTEDNTAELCSNVQNLKSSLECLREEQERERNMLEEALKLLNTLVTKPSAEPKRAAESAVQTSPGLKQPFSNILHENKLKGRQRKSTCKSFTLESSQAEVPSQRPGSFKGHRKSATRGHRRRKKRPLVLSQRSRCTVTDENSQPVSTPLCERCDPGRDGPNPDGLPERKMSAVAEGCFITPLSCWSQDSDSSGGLVGIKPILKKLSAESKRRTPEKPEGLWQLFDKDWDLDFGF